MSPINVWETVSACVVNVHIFFLYSSNFISSVNKRCELAVTDLTQEVEARHSVCKFSFLLWFAYNKIWVGFYWMENSFRHFRRNLSLSTITAFFVRGHQRPRPFHRNWKTGRLQPRTDWLTFRKVALLFSRSNHFFFSRTFELKTANSLANHDCCAGQTSCLPPTKTTTCLQDEYKMLFLRWSVSIGVEPRTVPPTS